MTEKASLDTYDKEEFAIVPEVGKLLLNTVEIEKAFLAGRRYNERA